jgi:hypothetical protein
VAVGVRDRPTEADAQALLLRVLDALAEQSAQLARLAEDNAALSQRLPTVAFSTSAASRSVRRSSQGPHLD